MPRMPSVRGGDHAKERESMVFYAIFWSTYVPFVLLTLSLLAERLTYHAESDGAIAGASLSEALEPCSQGRRRSQVTLSFAPKSGAILAPNAALL